MKKLIVNEHLYQCFFLIEFDFIGKATSVRVKSVVQVSDVAPGDLVCVNTDKIE